MATNDERKHMNRVSDLGCVVCRNLGTITNETSYPACIHHIREGKGMGQRASNYEVIPLCHFHHQGRNGIHTIGTKAWRAKYGSEKDLLAQTLKDVETFHGRNS